MTNGEFYKKFVNTEAKEWIKCAAKACLGGGLVGVGLALIANNCYEAGKKDTFMAVGNAVLSNEDYAKQEFD